VRRQGAPHSPLFLNASSGLKRVADIFIGSYTFSHQKPTSGSSMIITETQRFVYSLLALTFVTIALLILLNVYALEVFLLLIIIEFLVLVELTKPSVIDMAWRKNIAVFVVICVIVFAIILYQRTVPLLR
jgi:TctA family transporter